MWPLEVIVTLFSLLALLPPLAIQLLWRDWQLGGPQRYIFFMLLINLVTMATWVAHIVGEAMVTNPLNTMSWCAWFAVRMGFMFATFLELSTMIWYAHNAVKTCNPLPRRIQNRIHIISFVLAIVLMLGVGLSCGRMCAEDRYTSRQAVCPVGAQVSLVLLLLSIIPALLYGRLMVAVRRHAKESSELHGALSQVGHLSRVDKQRRLKILEMRDGIVNTVISPLRWYPVWFLIFSPACIMYLSSVGFTVTTTGNMDNDDNYLRHAAHILFEFASGMAAATVFFLAKENRARLSWTAMKRQYASRRSYVVASGAGGGKPSRKRVRMNTEVETHTLSENLLQEDTWEDAHKFGSSSGSSDGGEDGGAGGNGDGGWEDGESGIDHGSRTRAAQLERAPGMGMHVVAGVGEVID